MRHAGLLALLAGGALAASSVATAAAPVLPPEPPPSSAGYQPRDELERGLWFEMDEQERLLRESKLVVTEAALNAYVRQVLCRAVGQERCRAARLYIVRTPYSNASMAPNGVMLVYTGLLLRMRDEAQLAAVLAHEFTHFEQRHTLRLFKDMRARSDALSWLSFVPVPYLGMVSQVALIGGLYAFSRDMERQADSGSIAELAGAGYDPRAASAIWRQLGAELDATARARGHSSQKDRNGGMVATHPKTTERMQALAGEAAALAQVSPGVTRPGEYRAAIGPWWARLIDDQISLQDFGGSEYLFGTLAAESGWTADLLYARAELYRSRGKAGDFAEAARLYRQAIAEGGRSGQAALPEAWRGLGLAQLRLGQAAQGKAALCAYLARKPDAPDAPMLAEMARGA